MVMISVVIPILNQFEVAKISIDSLISNSKNKFELILIDDGSDEGLLNIISSKFKDKLYDLKIWRNEKPTGSYYTMKKGFELANGDIIAFFHSDLVVWEKNWDERLVNEFKNDNKLGLIGFIGSNEIDFMGGRGMGTMSNFQGREIKGYKGSPAEIHGKRINELKKGVVIDGCSMIFRREVLKKIGFRNDFPPHHFYDRLLSCQTRENGWDIGILGIACDHFGGQTVSREDKYLQLTKEWMEAKFGNIDNWVNVYKDWIENQNNPNFGRKPLNPDHWVYLEAEREFLTEYRDEKHLIPCNI